jgi:hypothetical protein
MLEDAGKPWKSSQDGLNPTLAFILCLLAGPIGFLYFGIAEMAAVGAVFLAGAACSYWIWSAMFPEFIGFSLVLLAFTARRSASCPDANASRREAKWPAGSFARARLLSISLSIDLGILCLGETILGQIWMRIGIAHPLGIFLSLCITLPVGIGLAMVVRQRLLGVHSR